MEKYREEVVYSPRHLDGGNINSRVTCTLSVLLASTVETCVGFPGTIPLNLHPPVSVLQPLSGEQTCRLYDVLRLTYLHGWGQVSWVRIEREGPIPMGHCTGEGCVVKSSLFLENQGNQVRRQKESPGGGAEVTGSQAASHWSTSEAPSPLGFILPGKERAQRLRK